MPCGDLEEWDEGVMYLFSIITEYLIVATMAQKGKGNGVLKPLQDEGQGPLTKQET